MSSRVRGFSSRSLFAVLTLIPIIGIAGLLLFAPPDGNERWQFMQFVGRFHPLAVHLPIALLILVPVLEIAGRMPRFTYLLPAVDFLLGVAVVALIVATFLGWCLGRSGGYSGSIIAQHMWGALGVAAVAWTCWLLRGRENPTRFYAGLIVVSVGLVSFTGYRGGQLSQGENHLTEFMPEPLAGWMGVSAVDRIKTNPANGGPNTLYGARIQPVLDRQCVSCHGRNKHKANLRLDSFEAVMHGGKHGAVVKPGDSKTSELLRRITLQRPDDDAMPPDGKSPVADSDAKVIAQWIAAGASGTQTNVGTLAAAAVPPPEVTFEEVSLEAVTKQRADLAAIVNQIQQRLPNVIDYQSRGTADLVVNAAWMGSRFGDADVAALAPLRERIVAADFSRTAITDKSASVIAGMKHLKVLRMMHTSISDPIPQALAQIPDLEYLSLFDTSVSATGVQALAQLPKLQHVYVGNTKVRADAKLSAELTQKLVF